MSSSTAVAARATWVHKNTQRVLLHDSAECSGVNTFDAAAAVAVMRKLSRRAFARGHDADGRGGVPARERPWITYAHIGPVPVLAFAIICAWTLLLWAVTLGKIVRGAGDFFKYFTNWSWTLQTLFFTADLACYLDASGRAHRWLLGRPFWLVWGVPWLVFWLVFLMFGSNGDIIGKFAADAGVSMGVALIFDRLVHVLPVLALSLYAWHRWYGISHGVWWIRHAPRLSAVLMISADVFAMPLAFGLCYAVSFNARKVYDIDAWVVFAAIPLGILVLAGFSGVTYLVATRHIYHLYPGHGHDRELNSNITGQMMLEEHGYPAKGGKILSHALYDVHTEP